MSETSEHTSVGEEVLAAAATLVDAFGRHDTAAYFSAFSPDATFVFYTAPERLGSRRAYEELWGSWERDDGFRVLSCRSSGGKVQLVGGSGDVGVFTHDVTTVVHTNAGDEEVRERETIVFSRAEHGRWLAVHEHLSPAPATP